MPYPEKKTQAQWTVRVADYSNLCVLHSWNHQSTDCFLYALVLTSHKRMEAHYDIALPLTCAGRLVLLKLDLIRTWAQFPVLARSPDGSLEPTHTSCCCDVVDVFVAPPAAGCETWTWPGVPQVDQHGGGGRGGIPHRQWSTEDMPQSVSRVGVLSLTIFFPAFLSSWKNDRSSDFDCLVSLLFSHHCHCKTL